jgi:hypothetical protein
MRLIGLVMGTIISRKVAVTRKGRVLTMTYDNYNYEQLYDVDYSEEPISYTEYIGRDIKCLMKTKTTKSGEMLESEIFPSFINRKDYTRAKKQNKSRKEQQNLNDKNAKRKIVRLTNANFTTNDLWGTFGWDNERQPPTMKDAQRETVNFIARENYRRKKRKQKNLKYIYVIESTPGRPEKGEPETKYHLHIIMGGDTDRDEIEQLWNGGKYPQTRRLVIKDFGGLTGLATYISKEPQGKHRWGASHGLKLPKPKESYSKFTKSKIKKMVFNQNLIKSTFEKAYPGYQYSEQYPCEIKYNSIIGGFYLYTRMYKKRFKST